MRHNAFSRRHRKHHASANRFGTRLVSIVAVVQVRLDIGDAGIHRFRLGKQWTNLRPRSVSAHEELRRRDRAVRKGQLMPPAAKWNRNFEFVSPPNRVGWE